MLKGGYKILNFDGVNILEDTDIYIPNIYTKLSQTDKPILISGFSAHRDTFTSVEKVDDVFIIKDFYGYDVTINKYDTVRCVTSSTSNSTANVVNIIVTEELISDPIIVLGSYSKIRDSFNNGTLCVWKESNNAYFITRITELTDGYEFDVNIFGTHQQYKISADDTIERTG